MGCIPIILSFSLVLGFFPDLPFLPMGGLVIIPFTALIPIMVIVLGIMVPKTAASNRISGLKIEIPYASTAHDAYVHGGISPFESLLRMHDMDLLPNMKN